MSIKTNLNEIKSKLPPSCKLIAVSKTQPADKLQQAYDAGQRIFGENKVQEMVAKYEQLPTDIEWHLIGHLQTNKVKYIVPFVALIHSVDSGRLLSEINKQAIKANRIVPCLLQVHIAQEETKFGFDEAELFEFVNSSEFKAMTHVKVQGLMGMATLTEDRGQIKAEFASLRAMFDQLKSVRGANIKVTELSMGMSSDYDIAVAEGSTFVRIGTAIFGERNYSKT